MSGCMVQETVEHLLPRTTEVCLDWHTACYLLPMAVARFVSTYDLMGSSRDFVPLEIDSSLPTLSRALGVMGHPLRGVRKS